jgi:hypothetical protein
MGDGDSTGVCENCKDVVTTILLVSDPIELCHSCMDLYKYAKRTGDWSEYDARRDE